jgi:hypothetical protein
VIGSLSVVEVNFIIVLESLKVKTPVSHRRFEKLDCRRRLENSG